MIIESIKKINNKIKISKITENRIDSLDEGTINVPKGYKKGDFFVGFPKAANAFNKESHATDHGLDRDNYLYKYGDPFLLESGDYKYPELLEYFKTYGESYRDLLLRIFESIEETAKKVDKFDKEIKVIVVTHAQVNHIFKDLISLAEKIKKGLVEINEGELPFLAWREFLERYNNSKKDLDKEDVFFRFASSMDIDYLLDQNILNILKREIKYLKNLK